MPIFNNGLGEVRARISELITRLRSFWFHHWPKSNDLFLFSHDSTKSWMEMLRIVPKLSSNHRRFDCLLNRLFRRRSKKTSTLHVLWPLWWEAIGDRWSQRAYNADFFFFFKFKIRIQKKFIDNKCTHILTSHTIHKYNPFSTIGKDTYWCIYPHIFYIVELYITEQGA